MDTSEFCMGCMRPKGKPLVCPHCGYCNKLRNPMVLPYQAVLNNKFLIGRILGKPGGFGITYLAWDLVLHTTVAVKEYFPGSLATRSPDHSTVVFDNDKDQAQFDYGLEQFLREARTLAQFSHPNIVRVREFFQQNNTAYLVMDYYEGISLEEFVHRKGGKISEALAVNILLPILDGLHEVHQKKVLHRDIKPSNIYLTKGGTPILLDFGAARFAIGQHSQSISVILTAGFAPFEQYLQKAGDLLGPWTDIYAYGATLYAITTGTTPDNAINRHQKNNLQAPIDIIPTLSPQFSDAVMAALVLEPEHRPQTVLAFRHLLLKNKTEAPPHPLSATHSQPVFAIEDAAILDGTTAFTATTQRPNTSSNGPMSVRQETVPTPQSQTKTGGVKQGNFVYCPHCRARNNLALGQVYSQSHCQKCGKKMTKKPMQNVPAILNWQGLALLAVLLAIGWVLVKTDDKPIAAPAIAATPLPSLTSGPISEDEPAPRAQTATVNTAETHEVADTNDMEQTVAQDETVAVTPAEPVTVQEPRHDQQARPFHNGGPFPHRYGPPESAFRACDNKQRGDSCEDPGRPDNPQGVCEAPPAYDHLACVFPH